MKVLRVLCPNLTDAPRKYFVCRIKDQAVGIMAQQCFLGPSQILTARPVPNNDERGPRGLALIFGAQETAAGYGR